jgi:hypothetical protein
VPDAACAMSTASVAVPAIASGRRPKEDERRMRVEVRR